MSAQKTVSMNAKNRKFPMEYTRNIGIAAHIDAGKQPQQKEFYTTQALSTRWARCTKVAQ